jgi:hypothetical protein
MMRSVIVAGIIFAVAHFAMLVSVTTPEILGPRRVHYVRGEDAVRSRSAHAPWPSSSSLSIHCSATDSGSFSGAVRSLAIVGYSVRLALFARKARR